jgi:hypothetical protein
LKVKRAVRLLPIAFALVSGTASAQDATQPGGGWIVSQTTSAVDYSPIATASISSRHIAGSPPLRLSIRCRDGRTELAVSGPEITGPGDKYFISYSVNDGHSVQFGGLAPAFGDGVAFKGDAGALLRSLPAGGELSVLVISLKGISQQGIFSLDGMETVRAKISGTCKWPHVLATPNN